MSLHLNQFLMCKSDISISHSLSRLSMIPHTMVNLRDLVYSNSFRKFHFGAQKLKKKLNARRSKHSKVESFNMNINIKHHTLRFRLTEFASSHCALISRTDLLVCNACEHSIIEYGLDVWHYAIAY